jgi:hypothetical protein
VNGNWYSKCIISNVMSLINCNICVDFLSSSRKISGLIILKRKLFGTYMTSFGLMYTYRYERFGGACCLYCLSIARPFQSPWATVKIEAPSYCETLVLISSFHFCQRCVFELCTPCCYNSSLAFCKGIHCRVFPHSSKFLVY